MKFIDRVKIYVQAGTGGNGTVAFRREAHVPKGGPSGGDGGRGGSVIFVATNSLSTLLDLRYYREYKAQNGEKGHAKKMHGADADDLVIRVPVGTCVYDDDTAILLPILQKMVSVLLSQKVAVVVVVMQDSLHHVTQHLKSVKMVNQVKNSI